MTLQQCLRQQHLDGQVESIEHAMISHVPAKSAQGKGDLMASGS